MFGARLFGKPGDFSRELLAPGGGFFYLIHVFARLYSQPDLSIRNSLFQSGASLLATAVISAASGINGGNYLFQGSTGLGVSGCRLIERLSVVVMGDNSPQAGPQKHYGHNGGDDYRNLFPRHAYSFASVH